MANIVCALHAEARPLRDHFDMSGQPDAEPMTVYRGGGHFLIVSGPGKVAASAATSFLYSFSGARRHRAWLNIGIAGHGTRTRGTPLIAGKIEDASTSEQWFPQPIFQHPLSSDTVRTVSTPEQSYEDSIAYDMEASGFFETANTFSSLELIHVLKIISDNPDQPMENLTGSQISDLIRKHMEPIKQVLNGIEQVESEFKPRTTAPEGLEKMISNIHFTQTRKHQLKDRLQTLKALNALDDEVIEKALNQSRAGDVIEFLETRIDRERVQPWK